MNEKHSLEQPINLADLDLNLLDLNLLVAFDALLSDRSVALLHGSVLLSQL